MLTLGFILAATVAFALSTSRSPDDFLGKLTSTGTQAGASTNTISLSEGPDNEGMVSVTDIHTIPANGLTSSFTGTSSVNFGTTDSDLLSVGANNKQTVGVNAAQLPAGTLTGADANGVNLAGTYTGSAMNTGSLTSGGAGQSGAGVGSLPGVSSGGTGAAATTNTMGGSTFNTMGAPTTQTYGTPSVGVPYLPANTQQLGGATQYGTGTANNLVPGSMQYMTAPGIPGQTQTIGNQVPSSTTNTGNTWGQRNTNPMQNNGMYPQPHYNQANMYNNNNPYHYNRYGNPWGSYGYPPYNNHQMYGQGGYNPNSWHGAPPPNPNANMIGGNNNHMNGNGNMAGRNNIAGPPPGGNVGGGGGGGYNNNPYNSMGAWQAAQTQSWLYPMFLFDMMF